MRYKKEDRQKKLKALIEENPFLTDKEIASYFNVSIQTIRLDRLELNIPEMRERTKSLAKNAYKSLKSVNRGEVIGELVKLKLNNYAESYMLTTEEMALQKSHIIRGQHLFAQANSLAVATIDADTVLTGEVNMRYYYPVHIGDTLKAQTKVLKNEDKKFTVKVQTYNIKKLVFEGEFMMFAMKKGDIDDENSN